MNVSLLAERTKKKYKSLKLVFSLKQYRITFVLSNWKNNTHETQFFIFEYSNLISISSVHQKKKMFKLHPIFIFFSTEFEFSWKNKFSFYVRESDKIDELCIRIDND